MSTESPRRLNSQDDQPNASVEIVELLDQINRLRDDPARRLDRKQAHARLRDLLRRVRHDDESSDLETRR
jgi:hypothetical protein